VRVPTNFPVQTADALRKLGIKAAVVPGQFFPERAVKRKDEIAAIRFAQEATERAVESALDLLRESKARGGYLVHKSGRVTSETLKRVVDVALMRDGCVAKHTIISSGDQCVDPHDVGSGPIRPDTSIIFDVFPRHAKTGYFADMSRTVVRGKASSELKELYALVEAGQQYAFDRVKEGCNGHEIHRGIRSSSTTPARRPVPRTARCRASSTARATASVSTSTSRRASAAATSSCRPARSSRWSPASTTRASAACASRTWCW